MSGLISEANAKMDNTITNYQKNIASVRAGRASVHLLDQIKVESYGNLSPINQIGTITVQDSTMLNVQIWDKANVEAAEKAIRNSDLGVNPNIDGNNIRVPLPKLSEERRIELVKICANFAEQAKISIRNIRRDSIDELKKQEKNSEISEDELKTQSNDIQKITDEHTKKIDTLHDTKKQDIMDV